MDGVAALMNLRAWAIMPVGIHRGCSATQDTTSLCCLLTNIPMQARQHALRGRGGGGAGLTGIPLVRWEAMGIGSGGGRWTRCFHETVDMLPVEE